MGAHLVDEALCIPSVEEEKPDVPRLAVLLRCTSIGFAQLWCEHHAGSAVHRSASLAMAHVQELTAAPATSTNSSRLLMTAKTGTPDRRALMSSGLYATSNSGFGRRALLFRLPAPDRDSACSQRLLL